jgi:hypothetical protein
MLLGIQVAKPNAKNQDYKNGAGGFREVQLGRLAKVIDL